MILAPNSSEANRRVLVIDDSEIDRRIVRINLADENVEMFEASDAVSGIAAARILRPDLILLDLRLPDWDGFETIRRLKNDPLTHSIPVIFLSGSTASVEKAKGLDLGAVDFVSKPFDPIELRARARVALRTKYLLDLLEQRAHLDGLTGLGNRHAFEERNEIEWKLCCQRGVPLTVMIADLDHFKNVNDLYGHATGDEVLRQSALALKDTVRSLDFVGRYGGEEFVVISPESEPMGALVMAERFRRRIAKLQIIIHKMKLPNITVSVGVASTIEPSAERPEDLLTLADRALYQAKASGRNSVWYWEPSQAEFQPCSSHNGRTCSSSDHAQFAGFGL